MARKLKSSDDVMCLAVDIQTDLIISGYEDGFVKLWDLRCENESPILAGRCGNAGREFGGDLLYEDVSSLRFGNQKHEEVHFSAGKYIYRIDLRKADETSWIKPRFDFNEDDINEITISETDEMLAAADDDQTITIIDLKNARLLTRLKKHKNIVFTLQFRPGKPRELISGGYDCSLIHWDIFKSRVMGSFNTSDASDPNWKELPKSFNPSYVLSCEFGSLNCRENKSNILMAGTENGNLHCFHCEKNLLHYKTFRAHSLGVTQVRFLRSLPKDETLQNGIIFSGGNDGKIKFWDVSKLFGECPETLEARNVIEHGSKINCLRAIKNQFVIVCDTTKDLTLMPIDV